MTPIPTRAGVTRPLLALAVPVVVAACGFFGGGTNPRPDDPAAMRPEPPAGVATWRSLDWQDVTFEKPERSSEEQWDRATAVVAGPGGWVAVGSNGDVMGYQGRMWQSTDSLSWTLVESDLLSGLELVAVTATADAYVAIGTDSANFHHPTASILRSTDGLTWAEVATVDDGWAAQVAAGPGTFAAIVEVGDATDVLLSTDGQSWERIAGRHIDGADYIGDVAWDGSSWLAAGRLGDRAVVLRSPDGRGWTAEELPAAAPVEGILDVSAYRVVPGQFATLLLGIDRAPSCAEDDDWCPRYQAAWSWTAATGWQRLPNATWILDHGFGIDVFAAGDAGFLYAAGDDLRTSPDGWDWTPVDGSPPDGAYPSDATVGAGRVVAVGIPLSGDELDAWFGSALIGF